MNEVTFSNFVANLRRWATKNLSLTGDAKLDAERIEKFTNRASAWASASIHIGERVASILGREDINVRWSGSRGIAFTDGEDIFLCVNWFIDNIVAPMRDGDIRKMATSWMLLKGLIFHEVSHIIWTPRVGHRPHKDVRTMMDTSYRPRLFEAFNMLEDARIENLFTARYSPAVPVFVNLVREALVSPNPSAETLGLLIRGRHYLPAAIRDAAWATTVTAGIAAGISAEEMEEVGKKIDRFTRLVFPTDANEGLEIIETVERVLVRMGAFIPEMDDHGPIEKGKGDRVGETRKAIERVDDTFDDDGDDADADADADAMPEPCDDGEAGDGDVDADADAEGEGGGDAADAADADADGDSTDGEAADADADGDSTDGEAADAGTGTGTGKGSLEDLLDELAEELDLDGDIDREFKAVARAAGADEGLDTTGERREEPWGKTPVGALGGRNWARVVRTKLAVALGSVFYDAEDGYESGHSTGRLNVGDLMGSRGHHLDVFDRWVANADEATSFEVVVLIDTSGSMSGSRIRNASAAAWAIERALADNDIPSTFISFAMSASMLKTSSEAFSEGAVAEWSSDGGTSIIGAIRWANEIFARSDKTHKVLLTLTDGAFYADEYDMAKLNNVASSILIRLGEDYPAYGDSHGHAEVVTIKEASDLRKMPEVLGAKILDVTRKVLTS